MGLAIQLGFTAGALVTMALAYVAPELLPTFVVIMGALLVLRSGLHLALHREGRR